jgi:hypothetical protein
MLYIPEDIKSDSTFPFEDGEIVKIAIGNDSLSLKKPEWWEMLDWKNMRDAYGKLPASIRIESIDRTRREFQ